MAREVKEYQERREEIIATARQLFFYQGYEDTTVSDIIHRIGIAKGTFYHYFDSKEDLMIALAEEITDEALAIIAKITNDPELDARTKFQLAFNRTGNWKVENRQMMLELLRVMYSPNNLRLHETLNKMSLEKAAPYFAEIIRQGLNEAVWDTEYPDEIARIIFHMGIGIVEQFSESFLRLEKAAPDEKAGIIDWLKREYQVYEYAISRLLGTDDITLKLIDIGMIDALFGG